ncbi:aldo/keto reductase [Fodinicola acaciae]|uniref:aldo/keto reductase n=1 Tax=Fodinicola acaciae TaxID=2681555 RepID=UPI0013D0201A|nr:aldo/keto reductase [Fodinicola acaciae]
MDFVRMGRSGLKVSPTCLGAMNFGPSWGFGVDEDAGRAVVDAYLDAGHNFIDTSGNYNGGQSEEIVGKAIAGRRDSVVLATKAFMPVGPGPNDRGLSRVHLTRALDASLRRLGTDYVDLYQCHFFDAETPIEETMATLDGFVRAGKVRYLGCSNFTAAQIVSAQWAAERIGGTGLVSLQPQYSLINRDIEADILDTCRAYGLGTMIWGPLAGGILAGKYRRGEPPAQDTRLAKMARNADPRARTWVDQQLSDRNLAIAEEVGKVAAEAGVPAAAVALAWVRSRPGVTSVIIGPRTVEQCEQNLAALETEVGADVLARLDEVSGPAPKPVTGSGLAA